MSSVAVVTAPAAHIARQTIAHHSKSFALASKLLDARVRDQTSVVYAWCRRADDAVDEGTIADPLVTLRGELDALYAGDELEGVLQAFASVVRARAIPRLYPEELIAGMAMDVTDTPYATWPDLRLYCWRVAGVVGLMMTHVFGVARDAALVPAAQLGIAMQLTNICRDVVEDWERGRLYVPDDLLASFGAPDLRQQLGSPLPARAYEPLAHARKALLARADRYYRAADRGIPMLPWRAAVAVRAARDIYRAIGVRIGKDDHALAAGRAIVPTSRKLALAGAAAARIALSSPLRLVRAATGRIARVPTTTIELSDVPEP